LVELRSLADLQSYTQELAARRVEDDPVVRNWILAKQTTWLSMLTGAYLCFYLMDSLHEALSILI